MDTTPAVDNAVAWFGAHTVAHRLDVVDRATASIVDALTAEGSTVRFYNANGCEFTAWASGSNLSSMRDWLVRSTQRTAGSTRF